MDRKSEDFEKVEFPPRLPSCLEKNACVPTTRPGQPITEEVFSKMFDSDGRLVDEHLLKQLTFTGGISPSVRKKAWSFLFGVYPYNSTERERDVIYADYHAKYIAMKERWQIYVQENAPKAPDDPNEEHFLFPDYLQNVPELCDISAQPGGDPPSPTSEVKQQWEFMQLQAKIHAGQQAFDQKSLVSSIHVIDKDVPRTDRNIEFFSGDCNPHLRILRDILVTFAAFYPHIGYAQGMNDILARFLLVLQSEVEAFWCFRHFMDRMKSDFIEDGVLNKLHDVRELIQEIDPDLLKYLQHLQVSDMSFCHRWMLLCFKREFEQEDSLRCFEMLCSHHLELSSLHAQQQREHEMRRDFLQKGGHTRLTEAEVKHNLTFDVFMCVAILLKHRSELFQCADAASVFALVHGLTMKLDLDEIMSKAEALFYQYCSKSVLDCFEVVDIPVVIAKPRKRSFLL